MSQDRDENTVHGLSFPEYDAAPMYLQRPPRPKQMFRASTELAGGKVRCFELQVYTDKAPRVSWEELHERARLILLGFDAPGEACKALTHLLLENGAELVQPCRCFEVDG